MKTLALAVSILASFSVSAASSLVKTEQMQDKDGQTITVKYIEHDSSRSVRQEYERIAKLAGMKLYNRAKKQDGFAQWAYYADNTKACLVHYVKLEGDDNDSFRQGVIDHEVKHCTHGAYHKELHSSDIR
jgi:hypothetical protein